MKRTFFFVGFHQKIKKPGGINVHCHEIQLSFSHTKIFFDDVQKTCMSNAAQHRQNFSLTLHLIH